uniref:Trehalase n=1 Tax=Plectus sambesii TaxID=2011161 RepID=A0A914XJ67_9BILA
MEATLQLNPPSMMEQTPQFNVTSMMEQTPQFNVSSMMEQTPQFSVTSMMEQTPQFNVSSMMEQTPQFNVSSMMEQTPQFNVTSMMEQTPQFNVSSMMEQTPQLNLSSMMEQTPQFNVSSMMEQTPQFNLPLKMEATQQFNVPKVRSFHNIYCGGPLLEAVQKARLYADCKHFVDMPLKSDAEVTLNKWDELVATGQMDNTILQKFIDENFDQPGVGELEDVQPTDFNPEFESYNAIADPDYRAWARELHKKWPTLCRKVTQKVIDNPQKHSLIPLPNPFVVPGGRFREMYYWDSFFTIKGLLASGMISTARGMIANMGDLIEKYGYVPNGNRVYYLNRSQPPLLAWCLSAYFKATNDKEFIERGLKWLEREYQFFRLNRSFKLDAWPSPLFHYRVVAEGPRPESFREDVECAEHLTNEEDKRRLWGDIAAAAESGRDFSARWFTSEGPVGGKMGSTRTSQIMPVDLNAIMCGNLRTMAELYEVVGQPQPAVECRAEYEAMRECIYQ